MPTKPRFSAPISNEAQLILWAQGVSVHNTTPQFYRDDAGNKIPLEGGECCPDFSCCSDNPITSDPDVLAKRVGFMKASHSEQVAMLGGFLASALKKSGANIVKLDD